MNDPVPAARHCRFTGSFAREANFCNCPERRPWRHIYYGRAGLHGRFKADFNRITLTGRIPAMMVRQTVPGEALAR
jgi:hypothetical protein